MSSFVATTAADRVVVGLLALLAVPGMVVLGASLVGSPLVGLGLLVPGAVLVARERLARRTPGPDIHDRQLDRIVAALAGATALGLVVSSVGSASGRSALVPASVLAVVAALALLCGTRRLWSLRAAVVLGAAAWPAPWAALTERAAAVLGTPAVTATVAVGAAAAVVALLAGPSGRHAAPGITRSW